MKPFERTASVIRTALALALAAAIAGTGSAAPGGAFVAKSGLTGTVRRGPVTPVCRVGQSCYAPFKGTLVFTALVPAGSKPVVPVRAQTASTGAYTVNLEPNRYRVTTGARSRFRIAVKPGIVSVPPTGMRRVNFVVDTGIR
jgi:hypothetical protein